MRVTLVIGLFVGLTAKGQIVEADKVGCGDVDCTSRRFGGGMGFGNSNFGNNGFGLGQMPSSSAGAFGQWRPGVTNGRFGSPQYPINGQWSPRGQQWQIGQAMSTCYECGAGVLGFIGKMEQMILSLPLAIIRSVISIPVKIVDIAIKLGSKLLNLCMSAKDMLLTFVGTLFKIPAKIMLESVKLFLGFLQRVLDWGRGCKGQEYCQTPLPVYNGIGPCAGVWPCTNTIACATATCYRTARALQMQPDMEE